MIAEEVITARGLTRRFGDLVAVDGVDLGIRRGEVFGFLGPNGAGKSTLIRILVGLLPPSDGEVEVLGLDLPRESERLRPKIGYMTQKFSLYEDMTIGENLRFAAEIFGLEPAEGHRRVEEKLTDYGLEERRGQLAGTLSGGWKQRLALAVATVHRPELLVLDEPTAGVDPDRRRVFWEEIFELATAGVTVLVSTHYMDEAVRCHRLCMMKKGRRVAVGSPEELTEALADRVVQIEAESVEGAIGILRSWPHAASVTQLGTRGHVLLAVDAPAAEDAAREILRFLEGAGMKDCLAQQAEPSLEDVFVALSLGQDLGGREA